MVRRRHIGGIAVGCWLGLAATASAARPVEHLPMRLPGVAGTAGVSTWIVGMRSTPRAATTAARYGAQSLPGVSAVVVARGDARRLAAALRRHGLLTWAEPDVRLARTSAIEGLEAGWARGAVVRPNLPQPANAGPVGVIDDFVDLADPEVGPVTRYVNGPPPSITESHGTEVSSVISALRNGSGIVGVLAGAPIVNYGNKLTCSDTVTGIYKLVSAKVKVINMSLGGPSPCAAMEFAVAYAFGRGVPVVAASGNEFDEGNPVEYPAAFPHVLSAAAVDEDLTSSYFSSANAAVDLAAPGRRVPVAVPRALDTEDGVQDGFSLASGTSFAAPIVAAAVAWVRAARPALDSGQVGDVLRFSARDIDRPGYDANTGYGLVDIEAALQHAAPAVDPFEPNDGIAYVNGTAFAKPDPYIWRGTGIRTLNATADVVEDPADVYRIQVPRGARVAISVTPRTGNPDLFVFDGAARSLGAPTIGTSTNGPGKLDSVRLHNRTSRARTAFVAVAVNPGRSGQLNAGYRLKIRRG